MPKVEFDPQELVSALNNAISTAVMSLVKPVEETTPVKRGRGRPKKEQSPVTQLREEVHEDTKKEADTQFIRRSNVFNPKGNQPVQEQVRPKREYINKFHDDGSLAAGDKIPAEKYPTPSERRDPAVKHNYTCGVCNNPFTAYPSEVPQAYARFGDGREAAKPIVRCENCLTSAISARVQMEG